MLEAEHTTGEKFKSLAERLSKYDYPAIYFDGVAWAKSPREARSLILAEERRLKARIRISHELFPDVSKAAGLYCLLERSYFKQQDNQKKADIRNRLANIQMRYTDSEEAPVFQIALADYRALEMSSF